MRVDEIESASRWGVPVRNLVFRQDAGPDAAAVLFPGDQYRREGPLLYYPLQVCLERGCDALALEYGHQAARTVIGEGGWAPLVDETAAAVGRFLQHRPARVLFVSKSLGTIVAAEVARRLGAKGLIHLWLTPLPAAVTAMLAGRGAAFAGTADPHLPETDLRALSANPRLVVRRLPGADHSLLVPGDHRASLRILGEVCACCASLLESGSAPPAP